MKEHDNPLTSPVLEQVYLIERDSGLLCRILGLYAARGIDVQRADYAYAAPHVMTLKVAAHHDDADTAETVRVLVEKAATLTGVIAAAEQPRAVTPARAPATLVPRRGAPQPGLPSRPKRRVGPAPDPASRQTP
jgi:hypothetical protein